MIFVTFKLGRKQYHATVSSWNYTGKNLWLFIWNDENNEGNCGFIPNARVISSCISATNHARLGVGVESIIRAW